MTNPAYKSPAAVKIETASSGIGTFLEAYRDLIWGMRWLLSPAILFTLSLVISNSISISVPRTPDGVRGPESPRFPAVADSDAGVVRSADRSARCRDSSAPAATFLLVNYVFGGLKFPIAFFPVFLISPHAWWWGAVIGAGTAFVGSIWPGVVGPDGEGRGCVLEDRLA